jgi:DNA primase
MAAPDFKSVIGTIRDHNEITEVIGSYVPLKRAGSSYKACCPFHREKTPSFNVSATRQSFHCFGCGAGGDVFNFIMRYENLDFMQAARRLAERAHLPFTFEGDSGAPPGAAGEKESLLRLHEKLTEWYRRCLKESPQAENARTYLTERGLGDEAVDRFAIGYAPVRGTDWPAWAAKRGFTVDLLETAGIIGQRESGGWYDRFAGRLLFPIHDDQGRPIGYSGRVLPGDDHPAKYVNSPETPLFTKSKVIYGLHLAKREILDRREALVCEGQIDVIRCHLAGVTHAVAAQGTAITPEHARILKRFTDAVRLVLDADEAGKNAAMRSADVLVEAGLAVTVVSLPPGDDPDSLVRTRGPEALLTALDEARPALDFQIDTLLAREPDRSDTTVRRVARAVLESIARAPSDLQRDQMLQRAASLLGIRPDLLQSELRRQRRRPPPGATDSPEAPEHDDAPARPNHPREEIELIRLIANHPQCASLLSDYIAPEHLQSGSCRTLYTRLLEHGLDEGYDLMADLLDQSEECRRVAAMLIAEDRFAGTEFNLEKTAAELIVAIRRRAFEQERRTLEQKRRACAPGEALALDMELAELTLHLHTLRSGWEKAKSMLDLHRSLNDAS